MSEQRVAAGRPRSEQARAAVLRAVDDLVLEVGYADLTMKAIAERAGVSRQTLYRWWSTKAEVLFEAMASDASNAFNLDTANSFEEEVRQFLHAAVVFLRDDPAGRAYRILIGIAQQDPEAAALLGSVHVLTAGARQVVARAGNHGIPVSDLDAPTLTAMLTGPVLATSMGVGPSPDLDQCAHLIAAALSNRRPDDNPA